MTGATMSTCDTMKVVQVRFGRRIHKDSKTKLPEDDPKEYFCHQRLVASWGMTFYKSSYTKFTNRGQIKL